MSAPITDTVARCAPRRDGKIMLLTKGGHSALADAMIAAGTRVVIRDGIAQPAGRGR